MQKGSGRLALVTGGHGFLGSHLVDVLLERGYRVACLLRPERHESVFLGREVEIRRGDLRRREGLCEAVEGADVVFHVAGLLAAPGPSAFHEVNVEGTRRLAEAVARAAPGCDRFLYVSSQAAAGPSFDGRPIGEERPPRPISHYGRSKLLAERALRRVTPEIPWTVVRPPAVYGPRDEGILPLFTMAARGLAPGIEGRGRRFNLLFAGDVAEGLLAAAESGAAAGRTYFLADREGYSYGEIATSLGRAFGVRTRRIPVPDLVLDLAGVLADEVASLAGATPVFGRQKARELKARWWLCSAARAEREIGWRPTVALDDGIAATARWYMDAGKVRVPARARGSL